MALDLRGEVVTAVHAAVRAAGGDVIQVKRSEIVKNFLGRGASRTTLYDWLAKAIGTYTDAGVLPQVPAIAISSKPPVFHVDAGTDAQGFGEVLGPASSGLIEALKSCIQAAQDVMEHSRHPDGKVRMAKTLITASEHLRRTMETAAKVHETMVNIQKIDLFYDALMKALADTSPEVRNKVLGAIDAVNAKWRADS